MPNDPYLSIEAIRAFAEQLGPFDLTNSRWGWPLAEIVHFTGLCLLFGTIGFFDLRMLGVGRQLSLRAMHRLVPVGVGGFCLSVFSGSLFVIATPDQYLYNPAFQSKIALMGVAALNMALFYATTARAAISTPIGQSPPRWARVSCGVSLLCWLGVITCGRVVTAFRPPFEWCLWCAG